MKNNIYEEKKEDMMDLSFQDKNKLIQAIISVDMLGKPKCKTRRRRGYGAKGFNR